MKKYIKPEMESFSKKELNELINVGACSGNSYSCGCHSGTTDATSASCACYSGGNNVT